MIKHRLVRLEKCLCYDSILYDFCSNVGGTQYQRLSIYHMTNVGCSEKPMYRLCVQRATTNNQKEYLSFAKSDYFWLVTKLDGHEERLATRAPSIAWCIEG